MALWTGRQVGEVEVQALASTIAPKADRTTWHGVKTELMARQAAAIGLPFFPIPAPAFEEIDDLMDTIATFLRTPEAAPYDAVVWGDLFWEEARRQHDRVSSEGGKYGIYPLWEDRRDTAALARTVIDLGFRAIVTAVDTRALDAAFVGRDYDVSFLDDLPNGVDPCGERGEFHTFVWDGPVFREAVRLRRTRIARFGPDVYCDLALAG
jgi:uncharacterized protein (TIGR00290 family)